MRVSPARRLAFDILLRVERDAAFSTELLHSSGRGGGAARLDSRDHALATEIALGCLRRQGEIDLLLTATAERAVASLDPEVRAALRIACYQIRYLDRIPTRAAVSESVELVKMARKRSAAGFVNAVLRKLPAGPKQVATERTAPPGAIPFGDEVPSNDTSLAANYPVWMSARWQANYGGGVAAGICRSGVATPPVYLSLSLSFDPADTRRLLGEEGVETETTELPLALLVTRGRVHESRCIQEGRCRIQDLSSQCVVPLLEIEPQHSFLDLCAAPGGKTFHAIDTRGGSRGGVVAADRHLHRLRTLQGLAAGRPSGPGQARQVDCVALDAQHALPFRKTFDRILVDAPCTGTGTLARNPEIKWRLRPEDITDLAAKQRAILGRALDHLAPSGILVYSTCSLEPEENQEVIEAVRKERPSFELGAYFQRVSGREPGDGFFACQIRRR